MYAGPTVPVAPGRFSITNRCPRYFEATSARARTEMSVLPPGGHGTINVTGRFG